MYKRLGQNRLILFSAIMLLIVFLLYLLAVIISRIHNAKRESWNKSLVAELSQATVESHDPIFNTLNDAIARWQTRPFDSYRMLFVESDNECEATITVEHETVTGSSSNDTKCRNLSFTVTDLLNDLRKDMTNITWGNSGETWDGFAGVCDVLAVHSSFDSTWGYPTKVEYIQEAISPSNVGTALYEKFRLHDRKLCYMLGFYRIGYTIKELTPIEYF